MKNLLIGLLLLVSLVVPSQSKAFDFSDALAATGVAVVGEFLNGDSRKEKLAEEKRIEDEKYAKALAEKEAKEKAAHDKYLAEEKEHQNRLDYLKGLRDRDFIRDISCKDKKIQKLLSKDIKDRTVEPLRELYGNVVDEINIGFVDWLDNRTYKDGGKECKYIMTTRNKGDWRTDRTMGAINIHPMKDGSIFIDN